MSAARTEGVDWIGPKGQPMRRLEMHLSYACPQRCPFCSEAQRMQEGRHHEITGELIARTLKVHVQRGITDVHLTGGEPTIHPRFVDTLALAKKLGLGTSASTNGYRLCRPEFARMALPHLDEVMFSLHGPDADLHDSQTGTPGSFTRLGEAVASCATEKPTLRRYVNVVVTRANIDRLQPTVALAESLGAQMVMLSNPTPEGAAEASYSELAVPFDELAAKLPDAVQGARKAVVRFFGVPLCLLGEHAMLSNDLHWDPRATVEWVRRDENMVYSAIYTWLPTRRRVHVEACAECTWNGICAGVFDTAAQLWSPEGLRPILKENRLGGTRSGRR